MDRSSCGVGAMARLSDEALVQWVAASCQRHGVPVKVTDALVVSKVAVLLSGGKARPAAERGRASLRSEPPDEIDSGGINSPGSGGAGADDGVVEQGGDDGVLAGEVEVGPLSA